MKTRQKTRRERYDGKKQNAKAYPINLCCINFMHDGNLGFLMRSAACFGAETVHVIGSVPARSTLNASSGSLYDYVKIKKHSTPSEFLDFAEINKIGLVSAEICEGAQPIASYRFNFDRNLVLVVGNEQSGVPIEILNNSDKVYIPMPGIGFCLNTSQTANIMLYEAVRQYEANEKWKRQWDTWDAGYPLP